MILNTGARTDIVQYFGEWLLKRFEQGFVYARNPQWITICKQLKLTASDGKKYMMIAKYL